MANYTTWSTACQEDRTNRGSHKQIYKQITRQVDSIFRYH